MKTEKDDLQELVDYLLKEAQNPITMIRKSYEQNHRPILLFNDESNCANHEYTSKIISMMQIPGIKRLYLDLPRKHNDNSHNKSGSVQSLRLLDEIRETLSNERDNSKSEYLDIIESAINQKMEIVCIGDMQSFGRHEIENELKAHYDHNSLLNNSLWSIGSDGKSHVPKADSITYFRRLNTSSDLMNIINDRYKKNIISCLQISSDYRRIAESYEIDEFMLGYVRDSKKFGITIPASLDQKSLAISTKLPEVAALLIAVPEAKDSKDMNMPERKHIHKSLINDFGMIIYHPIVYSW